MIPTKREPPMTRRLPPAWSKGRFSGRESLEVVGGGFLYLSPLGVYNIHVTKLLLYPGAVLEGPKQQGIRSINEMISNLFR